MLMGWSHYIVQAVLALSPLAIGSNGLYYSNRSYIPRAGAKCWGWLAVSAQRPPAYACPQSWGQGERGRGTVAHSQDWFLQ